MGISYVCLCTIVKGKNCCGQTFDVAKDLIGAEGARPSSVPSFLADGEW